MTSYAEKAYDAFRVGDHAEVTRTFTQEDVERFAELSLDRHPTHLDAEYARSTRFGERVVHGMLTASLLSAANALLLGIPGAISVEQTLRFLRPVRVGDTITARSEVVELLPRQRRLRCRTTCVNQRGELVLAGEAIEQKD
ncbi:MaoC family dehydratase [Candidatus Binatia bacterium]|nr:MaoC family dehydratase [Candidatus Binatia bacterium]